MAIVKDYKGKYAHIIIHDDAYADLTPEELEQRKRRIERNISNIVRRAMEKKAENDRCS